MDIFSGEYQMMPDAPQCNLEQALELSIQHYRQQVDLLGRIGRALDEGGEGLSELALQWEECRGRAVLGDEALLCYPVKDIAAHPHQEERAELINQVLELNQTLIPRLNTAKALISHELREMKNGRSAIKCYRSGSTLGNHRRSFMG